MGAPKKKSLSKIFAIIGLAFFILAVFLFWLASAQGSATKHKILQTFPFPIMLVENQPIYSRGFYKRLENAKLLSSKDPTFNEADAKREILNRLIYETNLEILAGQKHAKLQNWKNFAQLPNALFQNNTLLYDASASQGREDSFKFWFYSQRQLNETAYQLGVFITQKLKEGENFGELARCYSQDKNSLGIDGDLGDILAGKLLDELKEPLLTAKTGDTMILPSRLGIHIIQIYLKKISNSGEDVLYLRQIYLKGENFEEWVKTETKDYKIINLIDII